GIAGGPVGFEIAKCGLPISFFGELMAGMEKDQSPIGNRKSPPAHPLPRGGTDFMGSHLTLFLKAFHRDLGLQIESLQDVTITLCQHRVT
ncbi:MAG TPA: hypothetical protein VJS64_18320, partial [Pyrinomonadaceae bacterium]|nr:hypothetical protein [Pyrinomonadaceae bacterium]